MMQEPTAPFRASGNPDSRFPPSRGRAGRMLHSRILLAVAFFLCVAALVAAGGWIVSLGSPPLGKNLEFSRQVLDRNGKLLRAYATADGRWRLPASVSEVDPRFFDLLFAYEDKRFRAH